MQSLWKQLHFRYDIDHSHVPAVLQSLRKQFTSDITLTIHMFQLFGNVSYSLYTTNNNNNNSSSQARMEPEMDIFPEKKKKKKAEKVKSICILFQFISVMFDIWNHKSLVKGSLMNIYDIMIYIDIPYWTVIMMMLFEYWPTMMIYPIFFSHLLYCRRWHQ